MNTIKNLILSLLFSMIRMAVVPEGGAGLDVKGLGKNDGKDLWGKQADLEKQRKEVAIKRAGELNTDVERGIYLEGLQAGIMEAGYTEMYARRMKSEWKKVFLAYTLTVDVPVQTKGEAAGQIVTVITPMDKETLAGQGSWLSLVNTAKQMASHAGANKTGSGKPDARANQPDVKQRKAFTDEKFTALLDEIEERATRSQVLILLSSAIDRAMFFCKPFAGPQLEQMEVLAGQVQSLTNKAIEEQKKALAMKQAVKNATQESAPTIGAQIAGEQVQQTKEEHLTIEQKETQVA